MILIWFDNSVNNSPNFLFKDSYFGVLNYRLSLSPDGCFMLSRFYIGRVVLEKYTDFNSLVNELISDISNNCPVIVRTMYEWTLQPAFLNFQNSLLFELTKRIPSLVKWLHVCDTHHGISPLVGTSKFVSSTSPDIITCNQAHHLHFFDADKHLINFPRISIGGLFSIEKVFFNSLESSRATVFFPSKVNRIHLRREHISNSFNSTLNNEFRLLGSRFENHENWLRALATSYSFVYIPLGSSIGLNNLIPCFLMGTPILSLPLPNSSGINPICSIFNAQLDYFDHTDSFLAKLQEYRDNPHADMSIDSFKSKLKALPTPSKFIKYWILQSHFEDIGLAPIHLDPYFTTRTNQRHAVSRIGLLDISLVFYEDIQNIIEIFHIYATLSLSFSNDVNSYLCKYLTNICSDFSSFASGVHLSPPCNVFVCNDSSSLRDISVNDYSFLVVLAKYDDHLTGLTGFSRVVSPFPTKPIQLTIFSRDSLQPHPI